MKNAHPTGSGRPPVLQTGQGYLSYFENDRREQWVFFLAGGNLGWGKRTTGEPGLKGLVLGVPEQLWVLACLHACGLVDVAERVVDTWQDFEQQINDYSDRLD